MADRRCRPIARLISAGQRHDGFLFQQVMDQVRVPRRGQGRPRTRPAAVMCDKAYSSKKNRFYLRKRKIKAVIPEKSDQQANRRRLGAKGGRPPGFDAVRYRDRNTGERCFNLLKQCRAVATPLRQARLHVSRHHRRRLDTDLAPRPRLVIYQTGPSLTLVPPIPQWPSGPSPA
jgi:transposase